MSIAADNVTPSFHTRRSISAEELRHIQEPACIFEGNRRDDDGEVMWLYTVAGWIDGQNIATMQGGATVGGEVIIVHGRDRTEADMIACLGLQDTIEALNREEEAHIDALAAQARLAQVSGVRRLELATAEHKNDDFVADSEAIRSLRGDGILLAAGRVQ